MRQFAIRILLFAAFGTIMALVVGHTLLDRAPPNPTSDVGDLEWRCYVERLKDITGVPVRGWGHLCIGEVSVKVHVDAADLVPGEVYTAWMAYVDAPGSCTAVPCPLPEFRRLDQPPLLNRFDIAVVDTTKRSTFACTVRGLTFAQGSQIQLLLVAHGSAHSDGRRARQILDARWPEQSWDAPSKDSVIARTHFTMLQPWD